MNNHDEKSISSNMEKLHFDEHCFNILKKLILVNCGIEIKHRKKFMVYHRLLQRLRVLHLNNFIEYCNLLKNNDDELEIMLDMFVNPSTSFFREYHHFEFLSGYLSDLLTKKNHVTIWSAGCSTGEEPYSIAIVVHEVIKKRPNVTVNIIATDISPNLLAIAKKGIYEMDKVSSLTKAQLRYFYKGINENQGLAKVSDPIRQMVKFNRLNLIGPYTMDEKFDIIFCRNVIIYFQQDVAKKVLSRIMTFLRIGGVLILGHAESLQNYNEKFLSLDKTVYEKIR
jgi:chemotaxis protein methyltransferase CheR